MGRTLEVVKSNRHLGGRRITVYAHKHSEATYDSFFGERTFYLKQGYELTITVKGSDWQRGDRFSMHTLVQHAWNWSNIPWYWA